MSPLSLPCYLAERNAVKAIKKVFAKRDVEAVLQRLDRLTEDEARTTAAQTLEVIYSLVQNMTMIMDGEKTHRARHSPCIDHEHYSL